MSFIDVYNDLHDLTWDSLNIPSHEGSPTGDEFLNINDLMTNMSVTPTTSVANMDRADVDLFQFLPGESLELNVPLDASIAHNAPLAKVLSSSHPTLTYSPNPQPRKKRSPHHLNGRHSVDQEVDEELASGTVRQVQGKTVGAKAHMDAAMNQMFLGQHTPETDVNANLLNEVTAMSERMNMMSGNYAFSGNSPNALYYQQQQRVADASRRKNMRAPNALNPGSPYLKVPDSPSHALDANFAKVQLLEMGYPSLKKDPKAFCTQVVNFLCGYCKILVGGFYINNNQSQNPSNAWILSCTYPSLNDFNQYFHYHVGERFIMQAAIEKRCFCVHSSSWENNSNLLSFLFVPIPNEQSQGNALGVMVLGTVLTREEELHGYLLFLDQVRKSIAATLRTLLQIQHNLYLLQKTDYSGTETETAKQTNVAFERYVVASLSNLKSDESGALIIGTNVKGLITYVSPAAQQVLGYLSEELVGKIYLTQLHDLGELSQRSREIEQEFGKALPADFTVISYKTVFTRGTEETRVWNWTKKDKTCVQVKLTIRPLNDDNGIMGFLLVGHDAASSAQASPLGHSDVKNN